MWAVLTPGRWAYGVLFLKVCYLQGKPSDYASLEEPWPLPPLSHGKGHSIAVYLDMYQIVD